MSKKSKRPIPDLGQPIIETHFHLDYLKEGEPEQIILEAQQIGVERFITIAVDPDNLIKAQQLAERLEPVYFTQGIHPHDADHYSDQVEAQIRASYGHPKLVAVGEIGLDYFYDNSDRKAQRDAFERQLQIAIDLALPVVIHTRDADDDTRAILANFASKMPKKGVIHSFTSGLSLAEYCLSEGFCLGFNGISTFPKAENVREIITATPIDQLLLETDAPFLTPAPYRGRENAPKYLPFIAEQVAESKQLLVSEVLTAAYNNSIRTFFS